MSGESETASVTDKGDKASYDRSTISFPYFDLSESVRMAEAMSKNVGNNEAADEQLAAWLNLSPKSSGYRSRVASARLFGLLEPGTTNEHRLTELGLGVVSDAHKRKSLADAFLKVPLFGKVYESWRGQQLPPAAALERSMIQFGVAAKQAQRARQVLERSATTAGFFEHGKDRLVRPGVKGDDAPPPPPLPGGGNGGGNGGGETPEIDPIISGLLARMPKSGSKWPKVQREKWLKLLGGAIDLIYEDDEDLNTKEDENG